MSRDDFDFINLTENLEKNTEELIREMELENKQKEQEEAVLRTDMYGQPGNSRSGQELYGQRGDSRDGQEMYRQAGNSRSGQELYGQRGDSRDGQELYGQRGDSRDGQEMYRQPGNSRSGQDLYEQRMSRNSAENRDEENPEQRSRNSNQNSNRNVRQGNTSQRQSESKRQRADYEEEEDIMSARRKRGKKSSKAGKKLKRKIIKIVIILAVLFGAIYGLAYSLVSKTNYEEIETDYVRPSDVEKVSGVKNILLIGTDARSTEEDGRSDSMIIVSINNKKNRIVMTSILRDSYVEIPGHGSNRINAAYTYGQEDLLIQTIEQNYKIPIDAYAKVDFFSFIDIVDAVGGVEIEITEEEKEWINAYLNETNELLGKEFGDGYLTQSGLINLTGKQALSYARIRYIGTDFGRTERQRKILTAVLDKVKKNPASVSGLISSVLPNVTTDMKDSELTMMAMKAVLYLGYDMEQFCLPADNTWKNANINGMSVLQIDFEANIQAFKDAVYGDGQSTTEETVE